MLNQTLHDRVMEMCQAKALALAECASTEDEMLRIFRRETSAYEALESIKGITDIKTALTVVALKTGAKTGFLSEHGDIIRGAMKYFAGTYIFGVGIINNKTLAALFGYKVYSSAVADGWKYQKRLTRKIPGPAETKVVLQAMAKKPVFKNWRLNNEKEFDNGR